MMNLSILHHTASTRLRAAFGDRLQADVPLARYTAARLGGPADLLLEVDTLPELVDAIDLCWREEIPFVILGGGSNALVSDTGVRGLVLVNRARQVRFGTSPLDKILYSQVEIPDPQHTVWAESGANFGLLARQAAQRGLAGLEWAVSIPGTVGGAVVGNAGAHGRDMANTLILAEILHHHVQHHQSVKSYWPVDELAYRYRSSILKQPTPPSAPSAVPAPARIPQPQAVVLGAWLRLEPGTPQAIQARMDEFAAHRKRTQPPGASLGSIFKNPPGDYAGRLIEAAGLKGARAGHAQISPLHANFFINTGHCTAADISQLIRLAQKTVAEKFAVQLELEIERLGDWTE